LISLAVLGAGIYGGGLLYRRIQATPKSPEKVRKEVYAFLRDKGHIREFTAAQPAATGQEAPRLSNELAALRVELQNVDTNLARLQQELRSVRSGQPGTASVTNAAPLDPAARQSRVAALSKELQVLNQQQSEKQRDLRRKQKELNRLADEAGTTYVRLGKELRRQLKDAATWEALYAALGNELFTAEQWMAASDTESRRAGVELAEEARQHAANDASSEWLAARVVEGFILPNVELADAGRQGTGNADRLLTSASMTFRSADETNNLIRAGEMLIARSSNPVRADYARSQLAYVYEQTGDYSKALDHLRAVKSSNVLSQIQWRIPKLEQRVKSAK
jgi:tetratricopeptide (TPR) repeat protein